METTGERREVDLERLLIATSRTFALAIPLLPEPTRSEVTLSYLLFRIADTFEDAAAWPPALRVEALGQLSHLLERYDPQAAEAVARRWAAEVPCEQPGYQDLLAMVPDVLAAFFALSPAAVEPIRAHVLRTIGGMSGFVARIEGGELRLRDIADLHA